MPPLGGDENLSTWSAQELNAFPCDQHVSVVGVSEAIEAEERVLQNSARSTVAGDDAAREVPEAAATEALRRQLRSAPAAQCAQTTGNTAELTHMPPPRVSGACLGPFLHSSARKRS